MHNAHTQIDNTPKQKFTNTNFDLLDMNNPKVALAEKIDPIYNCSYFYQDIISKNG